MTKGRNDKNRHKVVALGIDGPNGRLFDDWLARGLLPNIAAVAEAGVSAGYSHTKHFRNERCWTIFLSGQDKDDAGATFDPASYRYYHTSLQRDPTQLFYALGADYRVCAFDIPAPLDDGVNGAQVSGWGSELNAAAELSDPPGLLAELKARHGRDPKTESAMAVLDVETGEAEKSYRNPNLYDIEALRAFSRQLDVAVERRTDICLDLLQREEWDLFLSVYVEGHTANHMFWNAGRPYAFAGGYADGEDPMLHIMQSIDRGIGRIVDSLPLDRRLVIYTIDDTDQNIMDLPSMALLPEILYRWNFPDRRALRDDGAGTPVAPLRGDYPTHWKHEIWDHATAHGEQVLRSPTQLESEGEALNWNPAMWYQDLWPQMRAFALAPVSDGYIRVNLAGREAGGIVAPEDYARTLDELSAMLSELVDPRDGSKVVERIERVRDDPFDRPDIPTDLIVCWRRTGPFDTIDSPTLGRVGPLPFFRTGGHRQHGERIHNVLFARGPGLPSGARASDGHLSDVAPTLLGLMDAEPRIALEGKPLFTPDERVEPA